MHQTRQNWFMIGVMIFAIIHLCIVMIILGILIVFGFKPR